MARTRDLDEQQSRLSAATWAVLAEHGVRGLTLRAVAERAGCTTGLVLHAFPGKQALLAHARQLLHDRTRARADAVEASGAPPLQVLREVLAHAASLTPQARDEARIWVSFLAEGLSDAALGRQHVGHNRAFLDRIARLVAACRPEWDAAACRAEATSLVALVEGLNTLAALDPESYDEQAQHAALDGALARVGASDPLGV
ncbi:TetR/AcrR family transcriptional regulator [Pseudonocardia sp. GCM10023141]|uniref:TetR/AcrR family transcriptional regulator n=1 Tax=Pseudonocardia sp. GCM10023141 TaxID=3252653 RepID=UPI00360B820C